MICFCVSTIIRNKTLKNKKHPWNINSQRWFCLMNNNENAMVCSGSPHKTKELKFHQQLSRGTRNTWLAQTQPAGTAHHLWQHDVLHRKNLPDLFFRPSVAISQWVFRNAGLIENDGFCLEFRVCNPILNGRGDPFTCRGDTNLGKRPQLDTTWRSLETWRQINLKGDWTTAFPRCQWSQMVAASC